ncbi:MAG TPA: CerR family C-terminal domain-containing protein [Bauldia sp.]|nr:CerR family C-terminal domain-containing protein [Bauldia sp.]
MAKKPKAKAPARAARPRRDRGADTRAQLIDAGLDAFGLVGFEGASTREIAKAAKANLAAILYHFGGKEGLHLAVAEHIAEQIGKRVAPVLAMIAAPEAVASPKAARAALHTVVETLADVMLGTADAARWARFIVREQMQPTAAFDVIYRFLGNAVNNAGRLVGVILGRPADDEKLRIRVFTIMGQVLIFRVAQALVLRKMGWQAIGDAERAAIKRIVLQQLDDILDAEQRT